MPPRHPYPVTEPVFINLPNGSQISTTIHPETRDHEVICDLCGKRITLNTQGNTNRFFQHRDRNKCQADAARRRRVEAATKAAMEASSTLADLVRCYHSFFTPSYLKRAYESTVSVELWTGTAANDGSAESHNVHSHFCGSRFHSSPL